MSKYLHDDADTDDDRAMKYLDVFFENSQAKKGSFLGFTWKSL